MAGKFGQSLEPIGNWVPTRIVLVHQPSLSIDAKVVAEFTPSSRSCALHSAAFQGDLALQAQVVCAVTLADAALAEFRDDS